MDPQLADLFKELGVGGPEEGGSSPKGFAADLPSLGAELDEDMEEAPCGEPPTAEELCSVRL